MEENKGKKPGKIKGFFSGIFNKLDKAMKEKAKSAKTCCGTQDKKENSCCK